MLPADERIASCLRSTLPHARDPAHRRVARALAHPGVYLVLTARTFPIPYGHPSGSIPATSHALASRRPRALRRRPAVAAVVARDELTAFEALDLIVVDYEPLRTFNTPEEASPPEPRNPHLRRHTGNIHKMVRCSSATSIRRSQTLIACSRTRLLQATRTCRSNSTRR